MENSAVVCLMQYSVSLWSNLTVAQSLWLSRSLVCWRSLKSEQIVLSLCTGPTSLRPSAGDLEQASNRTSLHGHQFNDHSKSTTRGPKTPPKAAVHAQSHLHHVSVKL